MSGHRREFSSAMFTQPSEFEEHACAWGPTKPSEGPVAKGLRACQERWAMRARHRSRCTPTSQGSDTDARHELYRDFRQWERDDQTPDLRHATASLRLCAAPWLNEQQRSAEGPLSPIRCVCVLLRP